jgi:hypothetical protein
MCRAKQVKIQSNSREANIKEREKKNKYTPTARQEPKGSSQKRPRLDSSGQALSPVATLSIQIFSEERRGARQAHSNDASGQK